METLEELFALHPYSLLQPEKTNLLGREIATLTAFHQKHCEPYSRMLRTIYPDLKADTNNLASVPYLPVRLFKMLKLQSIPDSDVIRVLTSSGTSSQQVSRIAIDARTSQVQTRGLAAIVTSFIGAKRLPMVIIDSSPRVKKCDSMSARGAGIFGLATFGRDHFYALDENMQPDIDGLHAYVEKYCGQPILIFGFTFMIWLYFYQSLRQKKQKLDLNSAVLIHGGGWKKMQQEGVGNAMFKAALHEQFGIHRVHNFYGMVEQVGSIYMECESGFLHASNFSEILIRNHISWETVPPGEFGLIQTMSVFARSYPGHSLLTEDIGMIQGVDNCACGRNGTYFVVQGRVPQAELRGCSDTRTSLMSGSDL